MSKPPEPLRPTTLRDLRERRAPDEVAETAVATHNAIAGLVAAYGRQLAALAAELARKDDQLALAGREIDRLTGCATAAEAKLAAANGGQELVP